MKCLTIDIICLEGCNGTCRPLPIDWIEHKNGFACEIICHVPLCAMLLLIWLLLMIVVVMCSSC